MLILSQIRKYRGFSLLELLICLCIVGILVLVAYPSFQKFISRTHRLEAKTALLEAAQSMENYYAAHQSYRGADLASLGIKEETENNYYRLELHLSATAYQLVAIPLGKQVDDRECAKLEIDQDGIVVDEKCWD